MKCPVDGQTLMITDRSGIELDFCPQCRGVWLDRGELDKLIERSGSWDDDDDDDDDRRRERRYGDDDRRYRGHDDDDRYRAGYGQQYPQGYGQGYGRPKRRKSFLSEMFEFGD